MTCVTPPFSLIPKPLSLPALSHPSHKWHFHSPGPEVNLCSEWPREPQKFHLLPEWKPDPKVAAQILYEAAHSHLSGLTSHNPFLRPRRRKSQPLYPTPQTLPRQLCTSFLPGCSLLLVSNWGCSSCPFSTNASAGSSLTPLLTTPATLAGSCSHSFLVRKEQSNYFIIFLPDYSNQRQLSIAQCFESVVLHECLSNDKQPKPVPSFYL